MGSAYEFNNTRDTGFDLFPEGASYTDDSVMTLAVAQAILDCAGDWTELGKKAVTSMQRLGRLYPEAGYGGRFAVWLQRDDPQPYHSYGNGAAMRVSPCGFAASSLEEAVLLADRVTEVTHNHPEGMKAARAVASAIYLARTGHSPAEIRAFIETQYYAIDFTLDSIRPGYGFDVSCQGSVPQAFQSLFESTGFEDAVRNAVSLGGDSDTIGAITGGMAQAVYGVPADLRDQALAFLDRTQTDILLGFEDRFGAYPAKEETRP